MKYLTEPFELVPIITSISAPELLEIDGSWYVQATAYNEEGQSIATLKRYVLDVMVPDFQGNPELPLLHLCDSKGIIITGTTEE
mgnify:CR=1 FL=1